jgi:hypothetical protein
MKVYKVIVIFALFFNSCSSSKVVKNNNCDSTSSCIEKFDCYKNKLNSPYSHFNPNSTTKIYDNLLICTAQLAHNGKKEAQKSLFKFYKIQKIMYEKYNSNLCEIAEVTSAPIVTSFSKLRGKEAFELALEYAKNTTCREPNDYINEGNYGLNVIIYIINPMIKSVKKGYQQEMLYSNFDFDENVNTKPWDVKYCERIHREAYDKLIKAYKEGKIVLKKYGEN